MALLKWLVAGTIEMELCVVSSNSTSDSSDEENTSLESKIGSGEAGPLVRREVEDMLLLRFLVLLELDVDGRLEICLLFTTEQLSRALLAFFHYRASITNIIGFSFLSRVTNRLCFVQLSFFLQ